MSTDLDTRLEEALSQWTFIVDRGTGRVFMLRKEPEGKGPEGKEGDEDVTHVASPGMGPVQSDEP